MIASPFSGITMFFKPILSPSSLRLFPKLLDDRCEAKKSLVRVVRIETVSVPIEENARFRDLRMRLDVRKDGIALSAPQTCCAGPGHGQRPFPLRSAAGLLRYHERHHPGARKALRVATALSRCTGDVLDVDATTADEA